MAEEVRRLSRPYLVDILVDAVVSSTLWLFLFLFEQLARCLPVPGLAGKFFATAHACALTASFVIFCTLSVVDFIHIRRNRR